MQSMQGIRSRIKSIESTRQITQSMYLVSTTKVQKSRNYKDKVLPYCESTREFMNEIKEGLYDKQSSLFIEDTSKKALFVLVGSDRGLCGGYNINVVNKSKKVMSQIENEDYEIITVGNSLLDLYKRMDDTKLIDHFNGISETPFFEDAKVISGLALDRYMSGRVGSIYIVYTQFNSMLHQAPVYKKLLPLESKSQKSYGYFNTEPAGLSFLEGFLPQWIAAEFFEALVEAAASEESARVTSMDAAVKNSDEMIEKLSVLYNRARQDAITQEIIEIVNGASGLR